MERVSATYRPPPLQKKELMALFGGGRGRSFFKNEDCISEECELESECSEEGKPARGIRSAVSLEIYGLQRKENVYFSNQEYYRRLEELKSAHLRNMAELERMYISQGKERHRMEEEEESLGGRRTRQTVSGPAKKLQRINSQEELDFHDSSSGSDQSEVCGEDSGLSWTSKQEQIFERDILLSPDQTMNRNLFRFQSKSPCQKSQASVFHQTGPRILPNSKVTVPKPFQMMLREEEKKKRKVRTRSEIELENTLLRQELEELRECQKKFRATPAPAHTHLPLYDVISYRSVQQRSNRNRSLGNSGNRSAKSSHASDVASPQPFHFLERERRKREAKIAAELETLRQKTQQQTFKARPMPSSVYGHRHPSGDPKAETIYTFEREATEGQSDASSDMELDGHQSSSSPDSCQSQKCRSKGVKKHMELSIEMVKEREWSDPRNPTTCNICSPQQQHGPEFKSEYISV
ncbi:protein FAM161A [Pholidichthys leucotaenia]